jgi:Flp pilus assembly protein TadG
VRRQAGAGERERGASLVEFALVVPLLTLFLFGIVQFGIAYDMKQSINSAAREGARTAAIPTNNFTAVDAATRNGFQALANSGAVTVSVTNSATGYSSERVGLGAATGNATADGTASERTPCADNGATQGEGTVVVVLATVNHTLTIPFFGAPELTLEGKGEFRCERSG